MLSPLFDFFPVGAVWMAGGGEDEEEVEVDKTELDCTAIGVDSCDDWVDCDVDSEDDNGGGVTLGVFDVGLDGKFMANGNDNVNWLCCGCWGN